jgi:hypothetical protein
VGAGSSDLVTLRWVEVAGDGSGVADATDANAEKRGGVRVSALIAPSIRNNYRPKRAINGAR